MIARSKVTTTVLPSATKNAATTVACHAGLRRPSRIGLETTAPPHVPVTLQPPRAMPAVAGVHGGYRAIQIEPDMLLEASDAGLRGAHYDHDSHQ